MPEDTTNTTVDNQPEVNTEVDNKATEEEKALELGKGTEIIRNGEKVTNNDKEGDKTQEKEDTDKKEDKASKDTPEAVEQDVKEQLKAQEDAKSDLATKAVDYDALAKEYEENGSLSEESMKRLEGAGYPKSLALRALKLLFRITLMQCIRWQVAKKNMKECVSLLLVSDSQKLTHLIQRLKQEILHSLV